MGREHGILDLKAAIGKRLFNSAMKNPSERLSTGDFHDAGFRRGYGKSGHGAVNAEQEVFFSLEAHAVEKGNWFSAEPPIPQKITARRAE